VTAALLGAAQVGHAREDDSLSEIEDSSGIDEPVEVEA
jgi:hypothetical protein